MEENSDNKPRGCYKFGVFYFEENNKRLIVRGPNGRYELNFNNKWAYVFPIFAILLITLKILVTRGVLH